MAMSVSVAGRRGLVTGASHCVMDDRDARRNRVGIQTIASGRARALLYLGGAFAAYLTAFAYILGGAILYAV